MRIGGVDVSPGLILAPMAGVTDLAFRLLAKRFGCGLVVTEMVSAAGLVRGGKRTLALLESDPNERPLSVQIFGPDAACLAEAAAVCERMGADIVDINMGCPVKKVVRTGAGLALMRDPVIAARMVAAVRKRIRVPLTVKMRAGLEGETTAVEVAKAVESEGADAVAIHPRFRNTTWAEHSRWEVIGEVAAAVKIPVIGNGDVASAVDAKLMLSSTGCQAVMIGRAALGRPWIFREISEEIKTGKRSEELCLSERLEIIRSHLEKMVALKGPRAATGAFRMHLACYTRNLPGSAGFRKGLSGLQDPESSMRHVESFFEGLNIESC